MNFNAFFFIKVYIRLAKQNSELTQYFYRHLAESIQI